MMQIPLRMAREANGYTLIEAAEKCGISADAMKKFEKDSSKVPIVIKQKTAFIAKVLRLYSASTQFINFGTEADCIKYNRANNKNT